MRVRRIHNTVPAPLLAFFCPVLASPPLLSSQATQPCAPDPYFPPSHVRLYSGPIQVQPPPLCRPSMVHKVPRDAQEMSCQRGGNVSIGAYLAESPTNCCHREYRLDEQCGALYFYMEMCYMFMLTPWKATVKAHGDDHNISVLVNFYSAFFHSRSQFQNGAKTVRRTAIQYPISKSFFTLFIVKFHHRIDLDIISPYNLFSSQMIVSLLAVRRTHSDVCDGLLPYWTNLVHCIRHRFDLIASLPATRPPSGQSSFSSNTAQDAPRCKVSSSLASRVRTRYESGQFLPHLETVSSSKSGPPLGM